MKFRSSVLSVCLLMVFVLFACSPNSPQATPGVIIPQPGTTRTLPQVSPTVISVPDAEVAARVFLMGWQSEDYAAMYNLLTPASQDAIASDKFSRRYIDTANRMTLQKFEFEVLSKLTKPTTAQVAYRVTFHTKMLGDLTRDMTMNLSLEKGDWRVQWDDGLILPELHGGNVLDLELKTPTRGNLYDRDGEAIAAANDVFALGIQKSDMDAGQESLLLSELSRLTGIVPETIRAMYDNDYTYLGDYVPVGEAPRDAVLDRYEVLSTLTDIGLRMTEYSGRFYYNQGVAPHVTGYVQPIYAEELDSYLREGYKQDDLVGKAGLEIWGEEYLLGQRGATLNVEDPQGNTVTRLAQTESKPSQSIYTTIDKDLQLQAQRAITGFSGAIVVMERDTGRVLALVSSPGFDPNAFIPGNYNGSKLTTDYTSDGRNRLYNRASGNGYPLGSVFKIITMAAALESGVFTPEDTYDCQYTFTELPGETLYDWTYEKDYDPSGVLNLPEGLMRSCNPWFYHMGVELFKQGHEKDVSNMARAFGLGSETNINGLDIDEAGQIPDPADESEAAQLAIGQGNTQVNPLQVARFIAAVGNGGVLYRPQLVEKITDPDGNPSFTFEPEEQGKLPVSEENLGIIQEAMRWVVNSSRGTAVRAFSGLNLPIYGKTGTAQTDLEEPHAWFGAYSDAGRTDRPDIAVAVIAEYAGEGSDIAAPIARRIFEVYFMGQPQKVYPWETRVNVPREPEPDETPEP